MHVQALGHVVLKVRDLERSEDLLLGMSWACESYRGSQTRL